MTDEVLENEGLSTSLATRLERLAREVAEDWHLTRGPRIASGRYSYVAPAGANAILKVLPPEDESASQQAEVLRFWAGDGAVRLLRHDPRRRALLLERLAPGTEAAAVSEDEGIAAAIAAGRRIWRAAPTGRHVSVDPRRRHAMAAGGRDIRARAGSRRAYAAMAPRSDTVLHADLHHHNILLRGGGHRPHTDDRRARYDVPPFLWNPLGSTSTRERTERRIRAFADAGLDGDRIRKWATVRGVKLGLPSGPERRIEPDRAPFRVVRELL